jgi:6-pyruvoyl-tetrahydropterin synthase
MTVGKLTDNRVHIYTNACAQACMHTHTYNVTINVSNNKIIIIL